MDHALWGYIAARDVWCQCTKQIQKSSFLKMSFIELMDNIYEIFENEQIKK